MTNEEIVKLYIEKVGKLYSGNVQIKYKNQSRLLKFLKPIIELYNKDYWNWYITTLGNTIYIPDDFYKTNIHECLSTVMHECVHIHQAKKQTTLLHSLLYLFPQCLSVFSIFAILALFLTSKFYFFLLFMIFLLPFPAPFRYKKELEAYRVDLLYNKHMKIENSDLLKIYIINNLSKSDYYFCWPFEKRILNDLNKSDKIFHKEKIYEDISNFLEENKHLIV